MSAATWNVDSTHHFSGETCLCGFRSPVARQRTEHITSLTEDAVRKQVAADIRALEHTKADVRAHVTSGGSVEECDGFDRAVIVAGNIAEGKESNG